MKGKHLLYLLAAFIGTFVLALILEAAHTRSLNVASPRVDQLVIKELQAAREKGDEAYNQAFNNLFANAYKAEIKDKEGSVHLERKENQWYLQERGNYPASGSKLAQLLEKIADMKVLMHFPEVGPSQLGRLQLLPPGGEAKPEETGTLVVLHDKEGKELLNVLIGKAAEKTQSDPQFGSFPTPAGRYVRASDGGAYLVSENFGDLSTSASSWLNTTFFRISNIKSIERVSAKAEDNWKLTRTEETADFVLEGAKPGEDVDSAKTANMKSAFGAPSFEDVMTSPDVKKPDAVTFNVETFDGFKYVLKFSEKNEALEYLMTLDVSANLATTRTPAGVETDEEKAKNDAEFAAKLKELQEKLATEKALVGHVYKVRSFVADSVNKTRAELMKDKTPPAAPGAPGLPGGHGGLPGMEGLPNFGNPGGTN